MGSKCGRKSGPQPALNKAREEGLVKYFKKKAKKEKAKKKKIEQLKEQIQNLERELEEEKD